jgi:hypothetical protein
MTIHNTPQEVLHLVPAPESTEPDATMPVILNLDDSNSHTDVLDVLSLRPFASGEQPWSRAKRLDRVRPEAPLRPAAARVIRVAYEDGKQSFLAVGDGWTLLTNRWRNGGAYLAVSAITEELAQSVIDESIKDATTPPPKPDESKVEMGFWHMSTHGPSRSVRVISADAWSDIRPNYTANVATALDLVMALRREEIPGRLLLLHGPPGTGKTTALRALARSWAGWCQADCVLDPERLFGDSGYLTRVAVGPDENNDNDEKRRWRLLILEDCDELIRGEAKHAAGQGLSRLLNLTDGMLGQGRDVLVAITTNEDLARLHPAVVRPGRCLAQIEVGRLTKAEAVAWLGDQSGDIGPDGATLAELAALRKGERPSSTAEPAGAAPGFYM